MRYPVDSAEARELREQPQEDPKSRVIAADGKPEWCGECDKRTRQIEITDGRVRRCPNCHPLTA